MLRILHLTDTHLLADEGTHHGRNTTALLRDALAAFGRQVDVVVATGDLSDDGTPASYQALRALVEGFATPRGIPVVYCPGNHDKAEAFRRELLPHSPGLDTVTDVGQWRIVGLDSHEPQLIGGRLREDQYQLLYDALSAHAGPSVVALHHPPLDPGSVMQSGIALTQPERLVEACSQFDVRAVLAGHLHHQLFEQVPLPSGKTLPVVVGPAVTHAVEHLRGAEVYVGASLSGLGYLELSAAGGLRMATTLFSEQEPLFASGPIEVREKAAKLAAYDNQRRQELP